METEFTSYCPSTFYIGEEMFVCELELGHEDMHEEINYNYDQKYIVRWDDGVRIEDDN